LCILHFALFYTTAIVPDETQGQPRLYRFDVYEADLRAGELRKHGLRLKLSGQPFQVLAILLQHAGEVVTREDLHQALWPSDTFVDFDHGLNTAINRVRAALGDSGANPRFVETLARRGYRFIAPVSSDAPAAVHAPVTKNTNETPGSREPALQAADDLPRPSRGLVRGIFCLAQVMYLALYVVALYHFAGVEREAGHIGARDGFAVAVAVLVFAVAGIPVRFFLLFAAAFDYRGLGTKFRRLFPAILLLDEVWALTPFLLADHIGFGLAFAATAALLYLPFGERTLVRMAYETAYRG
jgi:DNA-binding winged helix-turn-helix (wHTH) protein